MYREELVLFNLFIVTNVNKAKAGGCGVERKVNLDQGSLQAMRLLLVLSGVKYISIFFSIPKIST